MKAGILRESISIYKPKVIKTDFGSIKYEYEYWKDIRCKVYHLSGNKQENDYEVFYSKNLRFIVRNYNQLEENMRIKYEGKFYDIESIIPNKYYNDKEVNATLVND